MISSRFVLREQDETQNDHQDPEESEDQPPDKFAHQILLTARGNSWSATGCEARLNSERGTESTGSDGPEGETGWSAPG